MEAMSAFIKSINEIMEDNNISVRELAETVGCSIPVVRRWLYRIYLPEPKTLLKIIEAFKVSADYLFDLPYDDCYKNVSDNFYERYCYLRDINKITDYKVAKICNLGSGTISKWKSKGKGFLPETETLLKLSNFFQCSLNFILGI